MFLADEKCHLNTYYESNKVNYKEQTSITPLEGV